VAPRRADEHAALGHRILHPPGQVAGRHACGRAVHELDVRHQATSAHVADVKVLPREPQQLVA
jgi:hypothetical protein